MGKNNLHLDEARDIVTRIKDMAARIYRPGMSISGVIQNIVDYVGDKNIAIGAAAISFLLMVWSFSLFAVLFALIFSIGTTIVIFVAAKLIFYKPKEVSLEVADENTVLSFVKDVQLSGESEIVIHSQPGYGKEKTTFITLQLLDSISVLDCRNITSVIDKSYYDIAIQFFHPVEGNYNIIARSHSGEVQFESLEQSADSCRIKFLKPLQKVVRLDFKPA